MINPEEIRARFPVLDQEVNGHPLIYLDNAATTQKPDTVIKSVTEYYEKDNSNVHRGIHTPVSYTHLTLPTICSV